MDCFSWGYLLKDRPVLNQSRFHINEMSKILFSWLKQTLWEVDNIFKFQIYEINRMYTVTWVVPPPRMPVANEGLGWDPRT